LVGKKKLSGTDIHLVLGGTKPQWRELSTNEAGFKLNQPELGCRMAGLRL